MATRTSKPRDKGYSVQPGSPHQFESNSKLGVTTMAKASGRKIAEQREELRNSLWPNVTDAELWHRSTSDGWLTVPRALPLVLRIMDMLAEKGKPVSPTYLDLWCRTYDNSFVIASKPREMAFYAGFTGERAQHTWATRIRQLAKLEFIRVSAGASGSEHYILILNPFHIIQKHIIEGKLNQAVVNTLKDRMIEIGAGDLEFDLES